MHRRTLLGCLGSIGLSTAAGCQSLTGNSCGETTELYVRAADPQTASAVAAGDGEIPRLRESELTAAELDILETAIDRTTGYQECGERSVAFDGLLAKLPGTETVREGYVRFRSTVYYFYTAHSVA